MCLLSRVNAAYRLSRTTLYPGRAVLIECALESARRDAEREALERRFDRVSGSALSLNDLLLDVVGIVACFSDSFPSETGKKEYRMFTEQSEFFDACELSRLKTVSFAALNAASLKNTAVIQYSGNIDAGWDEAVVRAAGEFDFESVDPAMIYIGTGDNGTEAMQAMFGALLGQRSRHENGTRAFERERRICTLFSQKNRAVLTCEINRRGAGFTAVMAADPFVNPGRATI